jgi:hypothetical protein
VKLQLTLRNSRLRCIREEEEEEESVINWPRKDELSAKMQKV